MKINSTLNKLSELLAAKLSARGFFRAISRVSWQAWFLVFIATSSATAQPQRILQYEYDAAGNIVRIVPTVIIGPGIDDPNVTIRVLPSPVVIPDDGQPTRVLIGFSRTFDTDQTFQLGIANPNIASAGVFQTVLTAGESLIELFLTGFQAGGTKLILAQPGNSFSTSLSIIVQGSVPLQGEQYVFDFNRANSLGVFYSQAPGAGTGFNNTIGPQVNVFFSQPPAPPSRDFIASAMVGISPLPIASSSDISQLPAGTITQVTIIGEGLDVVSAVTVSPSTGITIPTFDASVDGTQLVIQFDVDAGAAPGARQLNINALNGSITFEAPEIQVLEIVN